MTTPTDTKILQVNKSKAKRKTLFANRPKKRLFIGMLLFTTLLVTLCLFAIWYIAVPRFMQISPVLPIILGLVVIGIAGSMFFGILNMVLAVKGLPYLRLVQRQTYGLINLLFPISVQLGKFFGIRRRKLEGSFVAVSNLLFGRMGIRVPADKLLVVTPHCLQLASCPHKITRDPENCKRCGRCEIGALVTLSHELGFHFFVATGGTLARQIVYNTRPKAVLAIACERDLMSGIQDVYPLPAVGVLNIRPNGPCYNTHVDMNEVRRQIEAILLPKEENTEDKAATKKAQRAS